MEIFELSKKFPKEEIYSLTDQLGRASRSVAINIREGFAKRRYEQVFIRHLNDALGSSEETRGWLQYDIFERLEKQYDELNAMLYSLMSNWQNFSDL